MKWSLLFFYCFSTITFAQNEAINIQGHVIAEDIDLAVSGMAIKNLATNQTTFTNIIGKFEIEANLGDTILFKGGDFMPRKLKITQGIIEKENWLVFLDYDYFEISQIDLSNFEVTGHLKSDIKQIKLKEEINDKLFEWGYDTTVEEEERIKNLEEVIGILSLDITGLIKVINGDYKKEARYREERDKLEFIQRIIDVYTEKYFIENLQIPEEKIQDFLLFAVNTTAIESLDVVFDELILTQIMEERAKIYRKRLSTLNPHSPDLKLETLSSPKLEKEN